MLIKCKINLTPRVFKLLLEFLSEFIIMFEDFFEEVLEFIGRIIFQLILWVLFFPVFYLFATPIILTYVVFNHQGNAKEKIRRTYKKVFELWQESFLLFPDFFS